VKLREILTEEAKTMRKNPHLNDMLLWFRNEGHLQKIRFIATNDKSFYASPAYEYNDDKKIAFASMLRRLRNMDRIKTPILFGTAKYNPFFKKFVVYEIDKKKIKEESPRWDWISEYVKI